VRDAAPCRAASFVVLISTANDTCSRQGRPARAGAGGHFAVSVSSNWRLTFSFDGADAVLVDYQDYH